MSKSPKWITEYLPERSHLLVLKHVCFRDREILGRAEVGRDASRLGTLECSPSPVSLRWHMWASQGHRHPSINEPHQMPSLGREEQLGLHTDNSWEETRTKWVVHKKPGILWLIIRVMMTTQIGHPLLWCTWAASGSQGEERRSCRLSSSIPGGCFPDLPWRQKCCNMVGISGIWLQQLGHL